MRRSAVGVEDGGRDVDGDNDADVLSVINLPALEAGGLNGAARSEEGGFLGCGFVGQREGGTMRGRCYYCCGWLGLRGKRKWRDVICLRKRMDEEDDAAAIVGRRRRKTVVVMYEETRIRKVWRR